MRLSTIKILALCGVPTYVIVDSSYRVSNGETVGSIMASYGSQISHLMLGTSKGLVMVAILAFSLFIIAISYLVRVVFVKPLNVEKYMQEQYGVKVSADHDSTEEA
jgi:hypothetical protein